MHDAAVGRYVAHLLDGRDTTSVASPLSILRSPSGSKGAVELVWRVVPPGQVHPPNCLDGAGEGTTLSKRFRADGTLEWMPPMFGIVLEQGDVMQRQISGGGGLGSAPERGQLDGVRDVVDDGAGVTPARDVYGVVVDNDRQLDPDGTEALRRVR